MLYEPISTALLLFRYKTAPLMLLFGALSGAFLH